MKRLSLLLPLCALVLLPACGSVKRELGVGRNSPDEFAVVKRAPLTLPPEYDLRPPGADKPPMEADSAAAARTVVLGSPPKAAPRDTGEHLLLAKMGATSPDPDIRATIDKDNGTIALKNQTVKDKLIFWKENEDDPVAQSNKVPESIVDATAETQRIKKNKAEGKPVNDGEVPVIEKKKSTLDKIF